MRDLRYTMMVGLIATCASWAGAAQAQLNDLFRGVSGALRGQQAPQQQQGLTTTMGVRGMEDGATTSAGPASADYALVETWMATSVGAQQAARKRSLTARKVTLRDAGAAPAPQGKVNP